MGSHPPPVPNPRLLVADLLQIQTYSGNLVELQEKRIARMTALARRDLRIRLMSFWGRAEEGDKKVLQDQGYEY